MLSGDDEAIARMPRLSRREFAVSAARLGLASVAASVPTVARPVDRSDVVLDLKRGINFHHMLNWPKYRTDVGNVQYSWPPFSGPGYETSNEAYALLRRSGFDFIRLTLDPSIFIVMRDDRRAWLDGRLADVVKRSISLGFKVIVDLHPVKLNRDYAPTALVISRDSEAFQAYADLVERLARVLDPLPADKVALELMNEPILERPGELPRWQDMLEYLHRRARAVAPGLALVLTGAYWGSRKGLMALDTSPFKGSRVLYTFHYYDPHTFTHQSFDGDDARYISGLEWPFNAANVPRVFDDAKDRIASDKSVGAAEKARWIGVTYGLLRQYAHDQHDEARVVSDFSEVSRWAAVQGIVPGNILLGELTHPFRN